MKTIALIIVVLSALATGSQAYGQAKSGSDQKVGDCFITTNGNNNDSKLVCDDLDPKVASQIKAILNGTGRTQAELKVLSDKLDQIIYNTSDRRLTAPQIHALELSARRICASFPLIDITASNANQEAQRFAMDFVSAFKASGCKSDLVLNIPGLRPDVVGLLLGVRDPAAMGPQALELDKILSEAGVQHSVRLMEPNFFSGDDFVLVVGAKE